MVGIANPTNKMKSLNQIFQSYADGYKNLVNERNLSTSETIKSALRLNKDEDWSFICASMDIVGDASLAIDNFHHYGLDGPTKYQDDGEKYLRLYGLLSATYMQQQTIKLLYKLNQLNKQDELKNRIDKLTIREVRHKLGAHSCDYENKTNGKIEAFVPIRLTLSGLNCAYFNYETYDWVDVDLKSCLEDHLELMIDSMDKIYEKSIKTFFRGNQKKVKEFSQELEYLRIEKNGGLVIESVDGTKIVIKTGPAPPAE